MQKYIDSIIPKEDVPTWKDDLRILIESQTGSGKTTFIRKILYPYAQDNGYQILYLINRSLLRKQIEKDFIGCDPNVIKIVSYQSIESAVKQGSSIREELSGYKFVVGDEIHYTSSDRDVNISSSMFYDTIKNHNLDCTFILLSATPDVLKLGISKFDKRYTLPKDYSYINKIFFYGGIATIFPSLESLGSEEKVIYFGNTTDCLNIVNRLTDVGISAKFICSDGNRKNYNRSSKETMEEIIDTNKFSCQVLCTTKVMDNGVSIIDSSISKIYIDMIDPIDIVQCLGRWRWTNSEDKLELYIQNNYGQIVVQNKKHTAYLKEVERSKNYETPSEYLNSLIYTKTKLYPVFYVNGEVNSAQKDYSEYFTEMAIKMFSSEEENGYVDYIMSYLGIRTSFAVILDKVILRKTISELLEGYVGKRIFGEDKEKFKKDFYGRMFDVIPRKGIKARNLPGIQEHIEEDKLPYRIVLKECWDRGDSNYSKRYWIVERI